MTMRKSICSLLVVLLMAMVLVGGFLNPNRPIVEAAGASWPVTITDATAITGSTTYTSRQWNYDGNDKTTAEIWYTIDQGTVNTVTLYLDASPDGTMWKSGYATIVSANVADATGYTSATIVGRYFRVRAAVGNSNPLTLTLKAIYK